MLQELLVLLVVLAAGLFIALRVRSAFKKAKGLADCCAQDCSTCGDTDLLSKK